MDCEEKKKTTCLVVAFYDGLRLGAQELHSDYLKAHKECLSTYRHNLDKIVFVFNRDDWRWEATDVLTEELNDPDVGPVTYLHRKNHCYSFGSWATTCSFFKDKFDYYIFTEDDYVFVKDDFDKILVSEHEKGGADYTVNWIERPTKDIGLPKERVALLEANERENWGGRLTSTCGIMSSRFYIENQEFFDNFDYVCEHYNGSPEKEKSMHCFMNKLKSVKGLSHEHNCFPYYAYNADRNYVYDWSSAETSEKNKERILLSSFQYYDENIRVKNLD